MPTREHQVSYRNGSQVMVAGLKLREIVGYGRGARVTVSRSLIQIINQIEAPTQAVSSEGLASRIGRLSRTGQIPREVAQFMRTVTEMRNETEYRGKVLTPTESQAVGAAWRAVTEWAQNRHVDTKPSRS